MDSIIQNIIAFTVLGLAILFLIRKFIWSPKKKNSKNCGGDDGCGCH
tara:strand:- start:267 stop:407 length:141 start_codon:yes stop_codon:yes gene_type:complete